MAFTPITVTGKYEGPDGSAASGTLKFTPSSVMTDSTDKLIVAPIALTATLDKTGAFSLTLFADDDTTTAPSGVIYDVIENITGADIRSYSVAITHTETGGTVDISELVPVTTQPATYALA